MNCPILSSTSIAAVGMCSRPLKDDAFSISVPYISRLKSRISRIVAQKRESDTPYHVSSSAFASRSAVCNPSLTLLQASSDT
eukprot:SAG31_NODE_3065_length_4728_cov_2.260531_4_plen_82_part_00